MKNFIYLIIALLLLSAIGLTACGGGQTASQSSGSSSEAAIEASAGDPVAGEEKFTGTCIACHGPGGVGVVGLGKNMVTSEFIAEKSDSELVDFIKVGRDPSDPLNTTGVAMPAKGGNPSLSDEDLLNIVSYIRTLQK